TVAARLRLAGVPSPDFRTLLLALGQPAAEAVRVVWDERGGPALGPLVDLLAGLAVLAEEEPEGPAVERRRRELKAEWGGHLARPRSVPPAEPDRHLIADAAGRQELEVLSARLLLGVLRPPPGNRPPRLETPSPGDTLNATPARRPARE